MFLRRNGFTLIEMVITLGLTSVAALLAVHTLQVTQSTNQSVQNANELKDFESQLALNVQKEDFCSEVFETHLDPIPANPFTAISALPLTLASGTVLNAGDSIAGGKAKLVSLEIVDFKMTRELADVAYGQAFLEIKSTLEGAALTADQKAQEISSKLPVRLIRKGNIWACDQGGGLDEIEWKRSQCDTVEGGVVSGSDTCDLSKMICSAVGYVDPSVPLVPSATCPNQDPMPCPAGQVMTGGLTCNATYCDWQSTCATPTVVASTACPAGQYIQNMTFDGSTGAVSGLTCLYSCPSGKIYDVTADACICDPSVPATELTSANYAGRRVIGSLGADGKPTTCKVVVKGTVTLSPFDGNESDNTGKGGRLKIIAEEVEFEANAKIIASGKGYAGGSGGAGGYGINFNNAPPSYLWYGAAGSKGSGGTPAGAAPLGGATSSSVGANSSAAYMMGAGGAGGAGGNGQLAISGCRKYGKKNKHTHLPEGGGGGGGGAGFRGGGAVYIYVSKKVSFKGGNELRATAATTSGNGYPGGNAAGEPALYGGTGGAGGSTDVAQTGVGGAPGVGNCGPGWYGAWGGNGGAGGAGSVVIRGPAGASSPFEIVGAAPVISCGATQTADLCGMSTYVP